MLVWGRRGEGFCGRDMCGRSLSPFERHDLFNVMTLLPVTTLDFLSFPRPYLRKPLMYAFAAYAVADSAWVMVEPKSVKDPNGILLHHALALGLLTIPLMYPQFQVYVPMTLSAEFNTLLLITKRHVTWRPLRMVLEGLFYSSWVVVRLALFPWMWSRYTLTALEKIKLGNWLHPIVFTPFVMGALCIMQFKWSWGLVRKNLLFGAWRRVPKTDKSDKSE